MALESRDLNQRLCETTIKINFGRFLRGGGVGDREKNAPKLFSFLGNATTIKKLTTIKIKFAVFEGGWCWGQREKLPPNSSFFIGKRHDKKI